MSSEQFSFEDEDPNIPDPRSDEERAIKIPEKSIEGAIEYFKILLQRKPIANDSDFRIISLSCGSGCTHEGNGWTFPKDRQLFKYGTDTWFMLDNLGNIQIVTDGPGTRPDPEKKGWIPRGLGFAGKFLGEKYGGEKGKSIGATVGKSVGTYLQPEFLATAGKNPSIEEMIQDQQELLTALHQARLEINQERAAAGEPILEPPPITMLGFSRGAVAMHGITRLPGIEGSNPEFVSSTDRLAIAMDPVCGARNTAGDYNQVSPDIPFLYMKSLCLKNPKYKVGFGPTEPLSIANNVRRTGIFGQHGVAMKSDDSTIEDVESKKLWETIKKNVLFPDMDTGGNRISKSPKSPEQRIDSIVEAAQKRHKFGMHFEIEQAFKKFQADFESYPEKLGIHRNVFISEWKAVNHGKPPPKTIEELLGHPPTAENEKIFRHLALKTAEVYGIDFGREDERRTKYAKLDLEKFIDLYLEYHTETGIRFNDMSKTEYLENPKNPMSSLVNIDSEHDSEPEIKKRLQKSYTASQHQDLILKKPTPPISNLAAAQIPRTRNFSKLKETLKDLYAEEIQNKTISISPIKPGAQSITIKIPQPSKTPEIIHQSHNSQGEIETTLNKKPPTSKAIEIMLDLNEGLFPLVMDKCSDSETLMAIFKVAKLKDKEIHFHHDDYKLLQTHPEFKTVLKSADHSQKTNASRLRHT